MVCDDGRPGHTHQAVALAQALFPDLHVAIPLCSFALRQPWKALAPRLTAGASAAVRLQVRGQIQPATVWIGAGRRSALVGRWARRAHDIRYIQILNPRVAPDHFDCVVAPEHDALRGANVVPVFGALTQVNTHALEQWRSEFAALSRLGGPRGVLLIGAPTARCSWDVSILDQLLDTLRDSGCESLLISASRRTPERALQWLRRQKDAALIWPDTHNEANPYRGLLAWGDAFAVTPDSVSMISEVLATGLPVVTSRSVARGKIARFLSDGVDRGLLLDRLDLEHRHQPLNEAQRIVPLVRERMDR